MKTKLASNTYKGNKEDMQRDFDEVIERYNKEAKGSNKADILGEFVRTINPLILAMGSNDDVKKQE